MCLGANTLIDFIVTSFFCNKKMEANFEFIAVILSKDRVFVKAITVLLDLIYNTGVWHIETSNGLIDSAMNSVNPEFVIIEYEVINEESDIFTIFRRKYPNALLCPLINEKQADLLPEELKRNIIYRQHFVKNFKEIIEIFREQEQNSGKTSDEKSKNRLSILKLLR